ncbi:putative pentatricopeptide repeat-containing protein At5g37570 [Aristolochia californica]|uniref:putative pentatricopeptide repeat-containing protein At5g37570 n=1 Tax=Aristolochia californica TaxID=171875 RepID=UPI0035D89A34
MTLEPLLSPSTSHTFDTVPVLRFCLQISKSVKQLQQTHARLLRTGTLQLQLLLLLTTQILKFQNSLKYARKVFDEIPQCQNLFVWTALIRAHTLNNLFADSLSLFTKMHSCGVSPNAFTFSSALSAAARTSAVVEGRGLHTHVVKLGFSSNKVVETVLLDMYSKCGAVPDARQVFDSMREKDIVSWTAMVSGYAKAGQMSPARELFDVMPERNVVSWTAMVAGYASNGELGSARELFSQMPERNSVSWTAMIAGYGKCGNVPCARQLFDQIATKDPEVHAAMIACYSQNGFSKEAIELYKEMKKTKVEANEVALVGVISACTQTGDTDVADMVASHMEERGSKLTLIAANALIHLHSKCGTIERALRVFHKMQEKDVISYSAVITGLAVHGQTKEALNIFEQMHLEGIEPNEVTFVGVLNACSHAGFVDEGLDYFKMMTKTYGLVPRTEHYACLADLLGRAGRLKEAQKLIENIAGLSDAGAWGALLGACMVHSNVEIGETAAKHLFKIEPENTGNYVLLANIYASVNRWADAETVRKMMSGRGLRKNPGFSWTSS